MLRKDEEVKQGSPPNRQSPLALAGWWLPTSKSRLPPPRSHDITFQNIKMTLAAPLNDLHGTVFFLPFNSVSELVFSWPAYGLIRKYGAPRAGRPPDHRKIQRDQPCSVLCVRKD